MSTNISELGFKQSNSDIKLDETHLAEEVAQKHKINHAVYWPPFSGII